MKSSDNLSALIYLKEKVNKWRNLAAISAVIAIFTLFSLVGGSNDNLSGDLVKSEYIANIEIEGVIFEDNFRSKILNKIANQKSAKAVIISINSPGGGIVGSEILYNNIKEISKNKPVVIIMNSLAASGGYMAAIAGNHILAHNGTLTGSIGVIMEAPEVTELAKKIGISVNTYKSSELKGSPSPFEKSSLKVDEVMQLSINDSFNFFKELVIENRGSKIKKENYDIIFDGRIFTGRNALKYGLVDEIGGQKEALKYLKSQKIDIDKIPVEKIEIIEQKDEFFYKFFGKVSNLFLGKLYNSINEVRYNGGLGLMAITR